MEIVFFGSGKFAVSSLEALITGGYNISCVVTQPDRRKDRGLHLESTAVKTTSLEAGLRIYQPENINTSESIKFLKSLNPDLLVVVSYGQILSQEVLDIPKIFAINAHASLLPKYRGAAPINWAIICGEKVTGVTIIKMTEKMDAGPIITQETINIQEDDTAIVLEDKLAKIATGLLIETVISIRNNSYKSTPQDESKISFAPKLRKEDGLINWNKSAQEICNLIRGVINWPGAFTYYNGKLLKIYKAKISSQVRKSLDFARDDSGDGELAEPFASSNPGEILEASKEGIVVFTGKGNIIIEELQIEGKRRMKVEEFIAGHKILPGEILGTKK